MRKHNESSPFISEMFALLFQDMEGPFVDAVGATIGDRFNENTEKNFRLFFGFVCDHMIQGYSAAGGKPGATENNRV